jgi:hypothetical protein
MLRQAQHDISNTNVFLEINFQQRHAELVEASKP